MASLLRFKLSLPGVEGNLGFASLTQARLLRLLSQATLATRLTRDGDGFHSRKIHEHITL